MRIYATATANDRKTLKAQGQRIADAWFDQRSLSVTVKAIKRIGNTSPKHQWGFIVLESIFDSYLCHYVFDDYRLTVTPESLLTTDLPQYIQCPVNLFKLAKPVNNYWRDCCNTYEAATKELSKEKLAGDVTLFLKKSIQPKHCSEPLFVLQRYDGEWFGIDCYGDRKFVSISLDELHAHCPVIVDVAAQKAMKLDDLAPDCVNTGLLIYKEDGDRAVLLGRPQSKAEIADEHFGAINLFKITDLHGPCAWD